MKKTLILTLTVLLFGATAIIFSPSKKQTKQDDRFVSYIVDPNTQIIKFYWKNEDRENFGSIERLRNWLSQKHKKLLFAMNGGMYKPDKSPQGLFIENNNLVTPLDTSTGEGNFYLMPNGVFFITTANVPGISNTSAFKNEAQIKYATQSGPMLLIDGKIHPAFRKGSKNLNIRNGVGVLPGNRIIFAMSKGEIAFYDFAAFFKEAGCLNALYLDGLVSRTYLPEDNWIQTDGDFGIIIGVTSE